MRGLTPYVSKSDGGIFWATQLQTSTWMCMDGEIQTGNPTDWLVDRGLKVTWDRPVVDRWKYSNEDFQQLFDLHANFENLQKKRRGDEKQEDQERVKKLNAASENRANKISRAAAENILQKRQK